MSEHQKPEQPPRSEGKLHEAHQHRPRAEEWPNYTPQAETDNEFPDDPAASQPPSYTPQAETDNEFPDEDEDDSGEPSKETAVPPPPGTNPSNPGRSGGGGQGRTDFGGEGRIPK